jgi:hypothetical protein
MNKNFRHTNVIGLIDYIKMSVDRLCQNLYDIDRVIGISTKWANCQL